MIDGNELLRGHPAGEQSLVEHPDDRRVPVDTFAGRVHIEWDRDASVTPSGQMAFFVAFLKSAGLFDTLVAGCPLHYTSPNAPSRRDVLGTALLPVLSGHRRYAHITALRADTVNPPLLGMSRVLSEDAIRRAFEKIEADAGVDWLREQLDYTTRPLLSEPWILDADTTVKPLYGEQESAVVGYPRQTRPTIAHLPQLHGGRFETDAGGRGPTRQPAHTETVRPRPVELAGSSRSGAPTGFVTRRQRLGRRGRAA